MTMNAPQDRLRTVVDQHRPGHKVYDRAFVVRVVFGQAPRSRNSPNSVKFADAFWRDTAPRRPRLRIRCRTVCGCRRDPPQSARSVASAPVPRFQLLKVVTTLVRDVVFQLNAFAAL